MARARPFQSAITAGEFSPKLDGRVDIQRYGQACKTLENFVALPHGAITRRNGTHYVATTKTAGHRVRLIPFEFSDTQAYVLSFGDFYFRVFMNHGLVLNAGVPVEVVTPYPVADLPRVKWVQSADVMYLVHPSYPVQKLTRTSHIAWTLNPVVFLPPPTTEVQFKPAATLTPAATTGENITFTASASSFLAGDVDRQIIFGASRAVIQTVTDATHVKCDILDPFPDTNPIPSQSWGMNGSPNAGTADPGKKEPQGASTTVTLSIAGFRSVDVGKYVKLNDGILKITSFTSSTVVNTEIVKVLSTDTAAAAGTWTLESAAWSAERGYPAAVTFHEGRLVFNASYEQPQTIWGSQSGDFENFGVGTAAGDAYEFSIAANKVNIGRWLLPSRVLLVGTKGGEFRVTGGNDLPITPTNVDAKSETAYGSNFVNPVRVGSAILFCQRSGRKLRELAFSMDFDSYVAPDLTVLAEHIFPIGKTMQEMDFQQDPDPIVWVVRSDGVLCALSYDRSNDVVGWHRHPIGGDAVVESVAVIPHPDGDREEVWLAVKRTINGTEVRYIEYQDDSGGFYGHLNVDSALTYSGAPATTFGGLEHLRGEVVAIVGDGAYYGTQTVPTTGLAQVVITPAASVVEVGLPYTSTFETLRAEIPGPSGSSQGQKKRQPRVCIRAIDTMGIRINGYQQPARRSIDLLGSPPSLFTGDYESSKLGWDTEARNVVIQALPFPATLLGLFGVTDVAEY